MSKMPTPRQQSDLEPLKVPVSDLSVLQMLGPTAAMYLPPPSEAYWKDSSKTTPKTTRLEVIFRAFFVAATVHTSAMTNLLTTVSAMKESSLARNPKLHTDALFAIGNIQGIEDASVFFFDTATAIARNITAEGDVSGLWAGMQPSDQRVPSGLFSLALLYKVVFAEILESYATLSK